MNKYFILILFIFFGINNVKAQITVYQYNGSHQEGQVVTQDWIHYTCPNDGIIIGLNTYALFGSPISFDGGVSFGSNGFKNQKTISIYKMLAPPTVICATTCDSGKAYFSINPENLPLTHYVRFRRDDGSFFYHSTWYTNINPKLIYQSLSCGSDIQIGAQYIGVSTVADYLFCLKRP